MTVMVRTHLYGSLLISLALLMLGAVACSSAPAPAATATPAKQVATSAPATQQAVTKAPEATKAIEPVKSTTPSGEIQKPADWPKKSVSIIVPADAGGATDVGIRLLAPGLEKRLGTSIVVVNKPGGGTQIGTTEIAQAKPDGYTIGATLLPATITTYLDPERKAAFTMDSFAPIGLHVFDPGTIAVAADSKYKTLKDLIDDAKANPEKIKIGDTGILGDDHLSILQLQKLTGVKFSIVHFTGGTTQLAALLGGHIDVGVDNVGMYTSQVKSGKVRVLAVTDKERSKFLPDVPTAEEQGVKLYSSSSRPLSAPKGTPKEIVWFISKAMEESMKDPEHIQKMDEQGLTLKYMNPDQLEKYWRDFEEQVKPLMELAREK